MPDVAAPPAVVPKHEAGRGEVFKAVARVISRLFDYPVGRITRETVASDVSGWDSLAHATLILEIEKALDVAFADDEMFSLSDVGALVDRAAELAGSGQVSQRMLIDDDDLSIVRIGEEDHGPDLIVFAGKARKFGGQAMMDFASTFAGTSLQNTRKFFVTDKKGLWFTNVADRIKCAINEASTGDKIVIGNSMGGYGALSVGGQLDRVRSILAFVPQHRPLEIANPIESRFDEKWLVRPTGEIATCIVFGEVDDEDGKEWVQGAFGAGERQAMVIVPNCGHNVVSYLNRQRLLIDFLQTALLPERMVADVRSLAGTLKPSAATLSEYVLNAEWERKEVALPHLIKRRAEEGLRPLSSEEMAEQPKGWRRRQRAEQRVVQSGRRKTRRLDAGLANGEEGKPDGAVRTPLNAEERQKRQERRLQRLADLQDGSGNKPAE